MKWKAAGPYAVISDCENYTISQNNLGDKTVYLAYFKKKGPVARVECENIGSIRKIAAEEIKSKCVEHKIKQGKL